MDLDRKFDVGDEVILVNSPYKIRAVVKYWFEATLRRERYVLYGVQWDENSVIGTGTRGATCREWELEHADGFKAWVRECRENNADTV